MTHLSIDWCTFEYAPVLDAVEPLLVHLGKALGVDPDRTRALSVQRCSSKLFSAHKPLHGDHGLNDLAAALRPGNPAQKFCLSM